MVGIYLIITPWFRHGWWAMTLKTGFIGYGSMGSMIVQGLLDKECLQPRDVLVSTRHPAALTPLLDRYPSVQVAESNRALAQQCPRVMLCTKPLDAVRVLSEISGDLHRDTHLISIAACLPLDQIARFFPGPVTRVVPSLTGEMHAGVTLLCHNAAVSRKAAQEVEDLFSALGNVVVIDEENIDVATDLTSCGPALIAVLIEEFARAAVRHSTLSEEQARALAISTLSGTARLLDDPGYPTETILRRVATPGGITEEGVKQLRSDMPSVYDTLIQRTLGKYDLRKTDVRAEGDRLLDLRP
ncbi:MAG: pyrroline-5-carboxylate reductase dimerization domain-containing protein [Methanoregula sp.]|nr:pyrroline-5-carboxylate reductase dimerization domain-containing protein [Methanoregula sp.]